MGSDICRWWVECFLTAESVPQERFCREKMKDCGVTYEVFCANADEFLKQKESELGVLKKRIAAEKQRLCCMAESDTSSEQSDVKGSVC